jgi:Tfp pilus assembly PilM family ATPase
VKISFEKLLSFLHVRGIVAGLEVSDSALRLVYFDGKTWRLHAIRLAPGVMEKGMVKDRDALVRSLIALKTEADIVHHDPKKKVDVVVSLGSVTPYSKTFRLPHVEGDELERAIALNIQMGSPGPESELYAGWQVVGKEEDQGQIDVLSAFVERAPVDGVVDALSAAGFVPMAIESKALAVARVFREKGSGIDIAKPCLLITIDDGGLEFLIVRNGQLYFEYAHPWSEIENERGEVSIEAFESQFTTSLRQVLNFYGQQWREPISAIVLSTVTLQEVIEKTLAANVALPAVRLTLVMGQPISSEWLVALGCSLRGSASLTAAKEVSFLTGDLEDRFRAEEMLRFLGFWQLILPSAFLLLIGAFFVAGIFLNRQEKLVSMTGGYTLPPEQSAEMSRLLASSTAFNNEVAKIAAVEQAASTDRTAMLDDVQGIAVAQGVTVSSLTVSEGAAQVSLSGIASTEDQVTAFKTAMTQDPHISGLDLPLTGITSIGGRYSFSMTFTYQ